MAEQVETVSVPKQPTDTIVLAEPVEVGDGIITVGDNYLKDAATGRFVSGTNGHGRPKGSRNKFGEAFLQDFYEDWLQHGAAALEDTRKLRPWEYVKAAASLLPRDLRVTLDTLSDGELERRIEQLTQSLGLELKPVSEPMSGKNGAGGT